MTKIPTKIWNRFELNSSSCRSKHETRVSFNNPLQWMRRKSLERGNDAMGEKQRQSDWRLSTPTHYLERKSNIRRTRQTLRPTVSDLRRLRSKKQHPPTRMSSICVAADLINTATTNQLITSPQNCTPVVSTRRGRSVGCRPQRQDKSLDTIIFQALKC